ncbi:urea transporter [Pseudarthrobacter sp. P1]|uniref:urea transporter n=1 Tax=Pseudarthrobacter sp. P1 TaxID=3418418 RepID=UPI003CF5B92B
MSPTPARGMLQSVLDQGRTLVLGLSQVFFHSVPWTGLLMLAAFALTSWSMALQVVLGAAANTGAARLLRVPRDEVLGGHFGFCGALVGAATYTALGAQPLAYAAAVLGGALCAPVAVFLLGFFANGGLRAFQLPATTAPFCLVATAMYWATVPFHQAGAAATMPGSGVEGFVDSILANVSEVVLINGPAAGALVLLGLFAVSWRVGVAAVLGSLVDSVLGLLLRVDPVQASSGLIGYSGVLTSVALAVVFLRGTWQPWAMAVAGSAITAFATLGFGHLAGPMYTWPFILTTWTLLVAAHFLPGITRDPPTPGVD